MAAPGIPVPATSYILVPQTEWADLRETSREARTFAMEARDSSRENAQTLAQVVTPKLKLVDNHEVAIQKTSGAMWAFGVIGTIVAIGLAALPFVIR